MIGHVQYLRDVLRHITDAAPSEVQVSFAHRRRRYVAQLVEAVLHKVGHSRLALPVLVEDVIVDAEERVVWLHDCCDDVEE